MSNAAYFIPRADRLWGSACLIVLIAVLPGCGNQGENPDVLFERGNLAATSGEMEAAVRHFTKALEKAPGRSDISYERGRAYEALGFLDKAIADYETCLKQEPNFEGAINNTGVCFAKMQRHEAAIEHFSKLIGLSPDNVLALRNRGLCFHDTQQFEAALSDYDAALEIAPEDPETWFQRGNVYLENGNEEEAVANYSEAVRIDSEFSKAWMNRGVALFGLDRQVEGMQDLTKASELDENIIIPDLDWVKLSKASNTKLQSQDIPATVSESTVVGKAVFHEAFAAGWDQVQADCIQLLVARKYESPSIQTAVPSQLCGILLTRRAEQKVSVYVGVHLNDSGSVQIPAAPTAPGAKRSLLVVKFDRAQSKFVEHQFIGDWQPTKGDISPATVDVKLP